MAKKKDPPLKINASFDDAMKVLAGGLDPQIVKNMEHLQGVLNKIFCPACGTPIDAFVHNNYEVVYNDCCDKFDEEFEPKLKQIIRDTIASFPVR